MLKNRRRRAEKRYGFSSLFARETKINGVCWDLNKIMILKIASIAIANDAILVSRNLKDFIQVFDLTVQDWTQ